MPNYKYQALTPRGEMTAGELWAHTEAGAIIELRNQGLYPTRIDKSTSKEKPIEKEIPVKKKKLTFGKWSIFFFGVFIGSILTYLTILSLY